MELVVVNGSNAIARGVISKLAGKTYSKIRLLDFRPYRKSVYAMQRSLASGVELEKHQVQTLANLELALEGAQDVVYFTHDYFANTSDKNNFIQATSRLAKKHGFHKMVAVTPIEHEMYWTEEKKNAIELRDDAQQKSIQNFDKLTILNTNLVFGRASYVTRYITQCAAAGKIHKSIGGSKTYQYKPVSTEDLSSAVETALNSTNDVKGQIFSVNGSQNATLNEILGLAEKSVGNDQGSTKLKGSLLGLGLGEYFDEFWTGITHDRNMALMAEFLDSHNLPLENDFHSKFGLQHKVSLQDFFGQKVKEEELVFPIFSNYKMVSLD